LSTLEKHRRHAFENMIDYVTPFFIDYLLWGSLSKFQEARLRYPFVNMKKLAPGSKGDNVHEEEVSLHNKGLVILTQQSLTKHRDWKKLKKYIRFRKKNRVTKGRLLLDPLVDEDFSNKFKIPMSYVGNKDFEHSLEELLNQEFGILIQPTASVSSIDRYALSHYRVNINWPEEDAIESLAKYFGYIERDLYENSEKNAEQMEAKLFEYYSFHYSVGGRRRAASVVAQYLKENGIQFTVFVGSQESRTVTRISNKFTDKYALLKLSKEQLKTLQEKYIDREQGYEPKLTSAKLRRRFKERFLHRNACVFEAVYKTNKYSKPLEPEDPKPRDLTEHRWLNIRDELILPKRKYPNEFPIQHRIVYARDKTTAVSGKPNR